MNISNQEKHEQYETMMKGLDWIDDDKVNKKDLGYDKSSDADELQANEENEANEANETKEAKEVKKERKKNVNKNTSNEKIKTGEKTITSNKYQLVLNLSEHQETYHNFENAFKRANDKAVGRAISREALLEKLVSNLDDHVIWTLQRESLTADEIDSILKKHLDSHLCN